MKDPKVGLSSSGGYPWFIDESSSTVVFIKNTTDKPQDFILSVIYPGGSWGLIHPPIPAGQTIAVDVRKLRDSQQKGVGDSVIPPDAVSGHISWGARGTAEKVLIGRAQTADFAGGMAATYECQCPCVPSWTGSTRMSPQNPTLFPGEQKTIVPEAEYVPCFGAIPQWFQVNAFDLTGFSNNPFVVTYSPNTATAHNVGSATISAQWTEQIVTPCPFVEQECIDPCFASFPTAFASTTVTVQGPQLTVNEVGFKKDYTITRWSGGHVIDSPDGTEPTWKSSGNPNYPVAYKAGAKPAMFAKFGVSPAPPTALPATVRVRLGSILIATKNNVSVSGSSITVNKILT